VTITDAIVRILAEAVTVGSGILDVWVSLPANAASPLDPNVTLSTSGNDLVGYLASAAIRASDIVCVMVDALF
jgi:hypothetical protein